MKIVIYKGVSQYQALRVFADELTSAFRTWGHEVLVLDFEQQGEEQKLLSLIGQSFDMILSMNGLHAELRVSTGEYLHDLINAPFYAYIVDHPLYHHAHLSAKLKRYHVLCVDDSFQSYIREYYPHIPFVGVVPQGGILQQGDEGGKIKPFSRRTKELVFMGTYRSLDAVTTKIEQCNETIQGVVCAMIEKLLDDPSLTLEEALKAVLKENGIELSKKDFAETMNASYLADQYVRTYYRKLIIKYLAEQGCNIDVYGENWEELKRECTKPECIRVHAPVSYRESLEVYQDSKLVLNLMPWSKHGTHDRLLNAMLCGAAVVTDESTLLLEQFQTEPVQRRLQSVECVSSQMEETELLTFRLHSLGGLAEGIRRWLQESEALESLAKRGGQKVMSRDCWEKRAETIQMLIT